MFFVTNPLTVCDVLIILLVMLLLTLSLKLEVVFFFVVFFISFLDRTISSVVEQHLFNVNSPADQSSEDCQLTPCPLSPSVTTTARQRRRQQREQQEEGLRHKERHRYNKCPSPADPSDSVLHSVVIKKQIIHLLPGRFGKSRVKQYFWKMINGTLFKLFST